MKRCAINQASVPCKWNHRIESRVRPGDGANDHGNIVDHSRCGDFKPIRLVHVANINFEFNIRVGWSVTTCLELIT